MAIPAPSTQSTPPFHRLLSFYSNQSPLPNTQTIRLIDSVRGNLSLGLDFPFALAIALGRHLYLHNAGGIYLHIHVPSVPVKETPLHKLSLRSNDDLSSSDRSSSSSSDEDISASDKRSFSCAEIVERGARANGWAGRLDALGLWAVAADVPSGNLSAEDVRAFQRGVLLERLRERRRDRNDQVLPLWRGGPAWTLGHSWVVKRLFDVDVYQQDRKQD